jgi:hypothetical protein
MKQKRKRVPEWITTSIQGLTFWVGYKRSLYRDYPLPEGALVTELRSLLYANLPDDLFLKCEVRYSKLVKRSPALVRTFGQTRADMVIANKIESTEQEGKFKLHPRFVLEFKRANAATHLIDKDLHRLAAIKVARPDVRTFLLVLSEGDRYDRFVDANGKSRSEDQRISGSAATFSVRRTVKAAPTFGNRESAHYGSIIEVVTPVGRTKH